MTQIFQRPTKFQDVPMFALFTANRTIAGRHNTTIWRKVSTRTARVYDPTGHRGSLFFYGRGETVWLEMDNKPVPVPCEGYVAFPYNPAYGVTDDVRCKAVALAKEVGVSAAAERTGFGKTSICRWRDVVRAQTNEAR